MIIRIKCAACMEDWIEAEVPDRPSNEASPGRWLEEIKPHMARAHNAHNALCHVGYLDLMIPVPDGTQQLGTPVKH